MSDRDARVEAVARALWRANRRDGKPLTYPYERLIEPTRDDLLGLARAALAAADAVREEDEGPHYLSLDDVSGWRGGGVMSRRRHRQPADDRRMVDRDTFVAEVERVLRERAETFVSRRTRGAFFMAADVVRDVLGGPAPSEATHRPKMPEVARKYDGEHGLVVEFEDEKP